ncbi:flagellar hook-length control protein FliK [Aureimonas flava]|uniref:Flagellar hook-length control protein FliK n=1 Tax=Aureimonas flava TaxID=2320271 RepID=A0A3A1WKR3_9HYPH|nr:flagellar hook-length control protein FliK [Aureimonas flava]RIY01888.1 flagellar hook-length control protein FliK [Aureimonas flava]
MKIDLSLAPLDKDGPARPSANADAERGAMGDAFGRAVRDAEGRRSANSNDRAGKATTDAGSAAATEAKDEGSDNASAAGDEAEASGEAGSEAAPMQSLLGALASLTAQKAAQPKGGAPAAEEAKEQSGVPATAEPDPGPIDASETPNGKGKGSMKLDVLRMETHFEPRQDGMVLVEGAGAASADAAGQADVTKTASGADAVAAKLADGAKLKSATAAAVMAGEGSASTASQDDGLPPMRFDEALARLGRAGGDRSGGETGRDGSAASQSALAELAARRSAAKGADAVAGSGTISAASPYNLAGQVAGPIMEALGDPGQASAPAASTTSDAHLRMRAGGGALKTLTIQLHPEHLGTVDVSLRLNEGRLTLELAASRSDTASMLLDDQASLRKLLEHAGFSLDDAAISVVTRDSGQIRTADGNAAGSQQRDAAGGQQGDGRSQTREQSGGSQEQPSRRQAPSRSADDTASATSRSGSTYL